MNSFTFLKRYVTSVASRLLMVSDDNTMMKLLFSIRQLGMITMSVCLIIVSPAGMAGQGSGALATTPFLGTGPAPNIMFLLDRSGSMGYCNNVDGPPGKYYIGYYQSCPSEATSSGKQRLCYSSGCYIYTYCVLPKCDVRVDSLKNAMCGNKNCSKLENDSLLKSLKKVRIGVYDFESRAAVKMIDIADIESNRDAIQAKLKDFKPGGNTPLSTGLKAVADYYKNTIFPNDASNGTSCRKNNIIVLSDGSPTSYPTLSGTVTSACGDSISYRELPSSTGFANIAEKLYKCNSTRTPDAQSILTHIVGLGPAVSDLSLFTSTVEKQDDKARYVTASDQSQLKKAFEAIIKQAKTVDGSNSAVTFNESTLSDNSAIFVTSYESAYWSGTIKARPLYGPSHAKKGLVNDGCTVGTTFCWNEPTFPAHGDRKIFTYDATQKGVAFNSSTIDSLSVQKADLQKAVSAKLSMTDIVDYIRGSTAKEGYGVKSLRKRQKLLGDIVNSSPVYVKGAGGAPNAIYVGSNDGMLHAFNADTGAELFAYIPSAMFSTEDNKGLHNLVSQDFIHRFYVDLTPAVATVGDRIFLIGGYRGGAKGVFALDVTNPQSFSATNVLWEYTNDDLGYVYNTPLIMNHGNLTYALVANGYDSTNNVTKIFGFTLNSTAKIEVVISPSDNKMTDSTSANNGLSAITTFKHDNGFVTYGGDLNGNLWRVGNDNLIAKMFQANQPITAPPVVSKHPTLDDKLMVLVGTGALVSETDADNSDAQSFYAILDWGDSAEVKIGDLKEIELEKHSDVSVIGNTTITDTIRTAKCADNDDTNECVDWYDGTSGDKGWYVNLGESKERVLSEAELLNGYVFLSTVIPGVGESTCNAGGSGWVLGLRLDGSIYTQPLFDSSQDHEVDKTSNTDKYATIEYVAVGKAIDGGMPTAPKSIQISKDDSEDDGGSDNGRIPDNNNNGDVHDPNEEKVDEAIVCTSNSGSGDAKCGLVDTSTGGVLKRVNWRQLK